MPIAEELFFSPSKNIEFGKFSKILSLCTIAPLPMKVIVAPASVPTNVL